MVLKYNLKQLSKQIRVRILWKLLENTGVDSPGAAQDQAQPGVAYNALYKHGRTPRITPKLNYIE